MSDKTCGCGHPKHSIPCPDISGDDGEGHVTICGCHRLVGDKLPNLPSRPWLVTKLQEKIGKLVFEGRTKDARIEELLGDAESSSKRLGDMQLESIRQENKIADLESDDILRRSLMRSLIVQRDKQDEHIAELEREIREAYKLLRLVGRCPIGWTEGRKEFLARNADKEQAS